MIKSADVDLARTVRRILRDAEAKNREMTSKDFRSLYLQAIAAVGNIQDDQLRYSTVKYIASRYRPNRGGLDGDDGGDE